MAFNFAIRSSLLIVVMSFVPACSMFWDEPATPLHRAAADGDSAAVRRLVAAGTDVDETDSLGRTALMWAARGGHPRGPHRCIGETAAASDVVRVLLELGASPNAQDSRPRGFGRSSGFTPLIVALHHEQFRIAQLMLERGANPNIVSDQGLSAIAVAANEGAPPALLALMLEKGFDPEKARRRE